jgi:hypothetical protein
MLHCCGRALFQKDWHPFMLIDRVSRDLVRMRAAIQCIRGTG